MKKKTIRQSKRLIISLFVTFFCLTASAAQAQTALVTNGRNRKSDQVFVYL